MDDNGVTAGIVTITGSGFIFSGGEISAASGSTVAQNADATFTNDAVFENGLGNAGTVTVAGGGTVNEITNTGTVNIADGMVDSIDNAGTLNFTADNDTTHTGSIIGAGAVNKTGGGTLTLGGSAANYDGVSGTFTQETGDVVLVYGWGGDYVQNAGTTLNTGDNATIAKNATLNGTINIAGSETGTLNIGNATTNTLTLENATLNITVSASGNDQIVAGGSVNFGNGGNQLVIYDWDKTDKQITVITGNSVADYTGNFTVSIDGGSSRDKATVGGDGQSVWVELEGGIALNLTWNGGISGGNVWNSDIEANKNWLNEDNDPDFFINGDSVTFAEVAGVNKIVEVVLGGVTANEITISGAGYAFNDGDISAVSGTVTVTGSATFNNQAAFTNGLSNAGTVTVATGGSINTVNNTTAGSILNVSGGSVTNVGNAGTVNVNTGSVTALTNTGTVNIDAGRVTGITNNAGGTLNFVADGAYSHTDSITGTGAVNKTGNGELTLSGSYTGVGTFNQQTGDVVLGSAWDGGYTQAAGTTLTISNSQTISGAVDVSGTVNFSGTNTTLTTGTLALNVATLNISGSGTDNNQIDANGAVSFTGTSTINLSLANWTGGNITIITGGITDFTNINNYLALGTVTGLSGRTTAAIDADDSSVWVEITSGVNYDLVWNGTDGAHAWNQEAANTNWLNGSQDEAFADYDYVTFNSVAFNKNVIVDDDGVIVAGMRVDGNTYVFSGGDITGVLPNQGSQTRTGKLEIINGAHATFNNEVSFTQGGIEIAGNSTVVMNNDGNVDYSGSFQYTGIDVENGSTLQFNIDNNNNTAEYTQSAAITGNGNIVKSGTGTLVMDATGAGSFAHNAGDVTLNYGWGGAYTQADGVLNLAASQTVTGNYSQTGNTATLNAGANSVLAQNATITGNLNIAGTGTGTLAVGGNLALNGATLSINASGSSNDLIDVAGSVSFTGQSTVNLSLANWNGSDITIITGAISNYSNSLVLGTVTGKSDRMTLAIASDATSVWIAVTTTAINLTWDGTNADNIWNSNVSGNTIWQTDSRTPDYFINNDNVNFGDITTANKNVVVTAGGVKAGIVTITDSGFVFSGGDIEALSGTIAQNAGAEFTNAATFTGGLSNAGEVTVSGSGSLNAITNANTGTVNVSGNGSVTDITNAGIANVGGGTVTNIDNTGTANISNGTVTNIDNAGTTNISGGSGSVNDQIAAGGAVSFNGQSTLNLSLANWTGGDITIITGNIADTYYNSIDTYLTLGTVSGQAGRVTLSIEADAGKVWVAVTGGTPLDLTWNGTNSANVWENNNSCNTNWLNDTLAADFFVNNDNVTFGVNGERNVVVHNDGVIAGIVTITGTGVNNGYTFSGGDIVADSGSVAADSNATFTNDATFTNGLANAGTVTVSGGGNVNDITNSGTVNIADGGSVASLDNQGTLNFNVTGTLSHDGALSGAGAANKTGTGSLELGANNNAYTGATGLFTQSAGDVTLNYGWGGAYAQDAGALNLIAGQNIAGDFTQANGTILNAGDGATLGQDATLNGTINIAGNNAGTLYAGSSTTNTLTLQNATLNITVDGAANDKIVAAGTVNFGSGNNQLVITGWTGNDQNITVISGYDVADYTGQFTVSIAGGSSRDTATVNGDNKYVWVELVGGAAYNLTWNGTSLAGTWDTVEANTNWLNDSMGAEFFANRDYVTFNHVAVNQNVDVVTGGVTVAGMVIDGTGGIADYVFTGGAINGVYPTDNKGQTVTGALSVIGGAAATFNNEVTFAKGANIADGTVTFANATDMGAIADGAGLTIGTDGSVVLYKAYSSSNAAFVNTDIANSGTLEFNIATAGDSYTNTSAITGAGGSVVKTGDGVLFMNVNGAGDFTQSAGDVTLTYGWGGAYTQSAGILNLADSQTVSGAYAQANGTTLNAGNATLGGTVNVAGNSAGTLNVGTTTTNTLTLNGATINITVASASSYDKIVATGAVDFGSSVNTISINNWIDGTYTIIAGNSFTVGPDGLFVLDYSGTIGERQTYSFEIAADNKGLNLILATQTNMNLTWAGTGSDRDWNYVTSNKNWDNGNGEMIAFVQGDYATFIADNNYEGLVTITQNGGVETAGMHIAGGTYTFEGNKISGVTNTADFGADSGKQRRQRHL